MLLNNNLQAAITCCRSIVTDKASKQVSTQIFPLRLLNRREANKRFLRTGPGFGSPDFLFLSKTPNIWVWKFTEMCLNLSAGYRREMGFYIAGMEEVRAQLTESVAGLSEEELSARLLPGAHQIGGLLLHIGETEWWWICADRTGRRDDYEVR